MEIVYFAMSGSQTLSTPISFFEKSLVILRILCEGRMHVYLFKGLNHFFGGYSLELISLFAHFVLHICRHLTFFLIDSTSKSDHSNCFSVKR